MRGGGEYKKYWLYEKCSRYGVWENVQKIFAQMMQEMEITIFKDFISFVRKKKIVTFIFVDIFRLNIFIVAYILFWLMPSSLWSNINLPGDSEIKY